MRDGRRARNRSGHDDVRRRGSERKGQRSARRDEPWRVRGQRKQRDEARRGARAAAGDKAGAIRECKVGGVHGYCVPAAEKPLSAEYWICWLVVPGEIVWSVPGSCKPGQTIV